MLLPARWMENDHDLSDLSFVYMMLAIPTASMRIKCNQGGPDMEFVILLQERTELNL
jgi:hypothetical protein